ncbi:hypothetical protein PoB_006509100 [Plakobranchus ocellatus]|uniref:Uncharacterized protein n=1 Tax=Plakobranchus ocellatus TaxID=259542 RepID=A0AAV4D3D6_9GAST|nr:hypothetical protein PoB_006509100 [Plakobranchus ocellatus]
MSLVKSSVLLVAFGLLMGGAMSQDSVAQQVAKKLDSLGPLVTKYGCAAEAIKCTDELQVESLKNSCGKVKDAGVCIYTACPKIENTDDEKTFVDTLLDIAKLLDCDLMASDITGKGGSGQTTVTLATVVLLFSALCLTKFFR